MGESPPRRSFLASARLVGILTLVSRILGMVRETFMSYAFGASALMDAFGIAYSIPNLFRRLFGEGALTAAFVPSFVARVERGDKPAAFTLLNRLITRLTTFLALVTLAGLGLTFLLPVIVPDERMVQVASMSRIMLPYVVFICGAAILGAALNSLKRFFSLAFSPILINLLWIGTVWWRPDLWWVAASILVGGLLQFLLMVPPLAREGARIRPDFSRDEGLREVGVRFLPVVFGLALVQINELVNRIIAQTCIPGAGAVSALYYGNQVMQLPLSLIGTSLATAVFPSLTGAAAGNREAEFGDLFRKALRAAIFVGVPASVGAAVLAGPIVELLYERGKFTPADTLRTTGVLVGYMAGLWCFCANQIQVRAFHAHGDTGTPVKVSASMALLNLALNLALVWTFREQGIAAASSISGLGSFIALNVLLRRRHPGLDLRPVTKTFLLSLLASAAMGAAAWGAWRGLQELLPGGKLLLPGIRVVGAIGAGAAVYFGVTAAMGMKEARAILSRRQ